MEYSSPAFLFPPRPENKVASGMLAFYEKRGWIAQVKKNGDCCVIITNGREIIFKTRQGTDVSRWTPDTDIINFFAPTRKAGKWDVFVAELMHSHGTILKNHLYIFEKIVHQGVQLVGTTQAARQEILAGDIAKWEENYKDSWIQIGKEPMGRIPVHPNVSVAKCFASGFNDLFERIVKSETPDDEGLVLKNPRGILQPCFKPMANDGWMVKVRRPTKNYGF